MSKRDDLDKEARGEMGLFGTLLVTGDMLITNSISKSNKKNNLKIQIDEKCSKISNIDNQINKEEGRFFLVRDYSKISSLEQKKNRLIKEKNELIAQYKKL